MSEKGVFPAKYKIFIIYMDILILCILLENIYFLMYIYAKGLDIIGQMVYNKDNRNALDKNANIRRNLSWQKKSKK